MAIEALLFDVFGTVVDWRSGVARAVEAFFAGSGRTVDAHAFADSWRAKYQPSMEEVRSGRRDYTVLDILHRENLDATLAEFGLEGDVDDAARARLNRAWETLPPWPDAVPGLVALRSRYLIAPCSNGSIALMARLARNVGLPWDAILGRHRPLLQAARRGLPRLRRGARPRARGGDDGRRAQFRSRGGARGGPGRGLRVAPR